MSVWHSLQQNGVAVTETIRPAKHEGLQRWSSTAKDHVLLTILYYTAPKRVHTKRGEGEGRGGGGEEGKRWRRTRRKRRRRRRKGERQVEEGKNNI